MADTLHIKEMAQEYQDYMKEMRREFHRHPEISGEEYHTREVLVREIESMGIPYRLLEGTGIIAVIKGGKPGKHRVLRADIDGLQVREDEENLKQKKECISWIAESTAECHGCSIEFQERNQISPYSVVNDPAVALRVSGALGQICGEEVLGECGRWYASECYSAYLEKYAGALGFLGIRNEEYGSGAAHHNGKFDIDESVLALGACAEAAFVFGK